jgi:hypothetical protein
MMQALEKRSADRPALVWRFRSVCELRKALEEYTAMIDLQLGAKTQGDGSDPDPATMDARYRIFAQNREIDRKMAMLVIEAPFYCRLLHWYYRTGNSCEAEGWRVAAKKAGLRSRRRMYRGQDMTREVFEVHLDIALRELFHAH